MGLPGVPSPNRSPAYPPGGSYNFSARHYLHDESRRGSTDYTTHTREGSPDDRRTDEDVKRRKIMRACDACRRKKIKCDGPQNSLSSSKCAHCQEYKLECTYVETAKRRGPPKGYMEAVEQRCARLERVLHQLHPGTDFSDTVGPAPDREDFEQGAYQETLRRLRIPPYPSMKPLNVPKIITQPPSAAESPVSNVSGATSRSMLGPIPRRNEAVPVPEGTGSEQDELEAQTTMAETMQRLNMKDNWRFHGKASPAHLFRLFNELKYKASPTNEEFISGVNAIKREQFWHVPEWEVVIANEGVHPLDFSLWPTPDLAGRLIELYFKHCNPGLPLLNKPLFMRQYNSTLYKSNHEFAKVCLMVFANGARFVDDKRVFWPSDVAMSDEGRERLKNDKEGTLSYSAGWRYLQAVIKMGRSMVQGPSLFDFQNQVLICVFLHGAAVPHLTWLVSGMGLRLAQEIGIHVRSTLQLAPPVERALYSRAFWCLYHIDRMSCMAIGRSVAIQDSDFDADYPIQVDDEYWDTGDPTKDFKQPESAGVPQVASFVHMLKLDHIIGAALRTIYAIDRHHEDRPDHAAQRAVVVELDSALNSWLEAVPDGLRWDPTRADQRLFEQSAILYAYYYSCQIMIHRSFIPTPRNPETVGLPSLAICTNAARSVCNILDVMLRRGILHGNAPGQSINITLLVPAWTAAIILMVSIYSGKQPASERQRALADVQKCISALKDMEITWRQAGKMTDMLTELCKDNRPDRHSETTQHAGSTGPSPTSGEHAIAGTELRVKSEPGSGANTPPIVSQRAGSFPYPSPSAVSALRDIANDATAAPTSSPVRYVQTAAQAPQANAIGGWPSAATETGGQAVPTQTQSGPARLSTPPPIFGLGTMLNPAQPWLTGGEESLFDTSFYDFGTDLLAGFGLDSGIPPYNGNAPFSLLGPPTPGLGAFGGFGAQQAGYGGMMGQDAAAQGQGQGMQQGQGPAQGGNAEDSLAWLFGPGR